MRPMLLAAGLCAAALTCATEALAADHEAGVPLTPAEAAGVWTLETGGRDLCAMTLGTQKSGSGFAVQAGNCSSALPGTPTAWQPTHDGMALVGADGARIIAFNRWSNSLFVSHQSSGTDLQLRRGRTPQVPASASLP
jgi:Protease inhibitor Inh